MVTVVNVSSTSIQSAVSLIGGWIVRSVVQSSDGLRAGNADGGQEVEELKTVSTLICVVLN